MSGTDAFDPDKVSYVSAFDEITARHHQPMLRATGKVMPALDKHCRAMCLSNPPLKHGKREKGRRACN